MRSFEEPDQIEPTTHRRVLRNPDDTGGSEWLIREMDASNVPGARAERCLLCESAEQGIVRRLWTYPQHWFHLTDEDLRQLCEA